MNLSNLSHYPPFGSTLPSRSWNDVSRAYRYGFNGKEKDSETAKDNYDFGARIYDSRLGRWLSLDPLGVKLPDISGYSFTNSSPIYFIDKKGLEPDRNQAGTIEQAVAQWSKLEFPTVNSILYYIRKNENAIRYIYTEDKGWIDLQHYFLTLSVGQTAANALEPLSGNKTLQKWALGDGADESYYSYEDLPSNQFANDSKDIKEKVLEEGIDGGEKWVEKNKEGTALINSIKKNFVEAKATNPDKAPNWKQMPFKDHTVRVRLPEYKVTGFELNILETILNKGIPVFDEIRHYYTDNEKKELMKTGKYVPQNHTSQKFDLNDFAAASTSIEKGNKEKGKGGW